MKDVQLRERNLNNAVVLYKNIIIEIRIIATISIKK